MRKALVLIMLILFASNAMSKDLGTFGEVFPIKEEDFLTYILKRIAEFEKRQGGIDAFKQKIRARIQNEALNPSEPFQYPITNKASIYYTDASITLKKDIVTLDGKVLGRKGQVINPFKHMGFYKKDLLFIDGSDQRQITWAKHAIDVLNQHHKAYTLILIKGNLQKVYDRLGVIKFDYFGHLSQKLGLKTTPSIVSEANYQWQVQAIACDINACHGGNV